MSCHNNNCGCSPSGYPSANNECCTDVAQYTRFAYSSALSAEANAANAQQSAEDAVTTLSTSVLKAGSTMTGPLILSGDPAVALGAATKQYVDTNDALRVSKSGDTMTGPLIVSVNSSSDGLRVTQVGSGNAILVEDSANPDSTPFVVDATGDVGIGTQFPQKILHTVGTIRFEALGTYANNAAAIAGGLTTNDVYKTATGELRIVV